MTAKILALDHLVLTVRDIAASARFYEGLGMVHEVFEGTDGTQRHALTFGTQKINLHQAGAEFSPHAGVPKPGSADLCFLVEGGLDALQALLRDKVIEGPIRRTGAMGPIRSIYLRDPDGNLIELSEPI